MCLGTGMGVIRVRVSESESCRVGHGPRGVNPVIAFEFKTRL